MENLRSAYNPNWCLSSAVSYWVCRQSMAGILRKAATQPDQAQSHPIACDALSYDAASKVGWNQKMESTPT